MQVFTYALECDGFLKVGRTTNVRRRVAVLQTGNPHRILIIGTVPGDLERRAHERLYLCGVKRVRGEWFADSPRARELLWSLGFDGVNFEPIAAVH